MRSTYITNISYIARNCCDIKTRKHFCKRKQRDKVATADHPDRDTETPLMDDFHPVSTLVSYFSHHPGPMLANNIW